MEVLLKGRFSVEYKKYNDKIYEIYGNTVKGDMLPNNVYDKLIGYNITSEYFYEHLLWLIIVILRL